MFRIAILSAIALTAAAGDVIAPDVYAGAAIVPVTLSNFHFTPATLQLASGRPIILRLVNDAAGGHDFGAPAFFAGAVIRPSDLSAVHNGHVELHAHQSIDIGLIPQAGMFPLNCDHPLHSFLGMKGMIIVK